MDLSVYPDLGYGMICDNLSHQASDGRRSILQREADSGNHFAQWFLGDMMYHERSPFEEDRITGIYYIRRAAEQGNSYALAFLSAPLRALFGQLKENFLYFCLPSHKRPIYNMLTEAHGKYAKGHGKMKRMRELEERCRIAEAKNLSEKVDWDGLPSTYQHER